MDGNFRWLFSRRRVRGKSIMRQARRWSPRALLATVFALALASFVLVRIFQPWLYVTMDSPRYLVFHNIAELFSIMVALSIFGISWFSYPQSRDRHALFLVLPGSQWLNAYP